MEKNVFQPVAGLSMAQTMIDVPYWNDEYMITGWNWSSRLAYPCIYGPTIFASTVVNQHAVGNTEASIDLKYTMHNGLAVHGQQEHCSVETSMHCTTMRLPDLLFSCQLLNQGEVDVLIRRVFMSTVLHENRIREQGHRKGSTILK